MKLILGDCIDKLKELDDNSVDSIVTDPPYGLSFMGKQWDYDVPSQEIFEECLRVLKPGGHLLAFAGSRTYHRMAVRIEDAGFEIRDQIMWIYGSGFPKSMDISKQIDKREGVEREVIGKTNGSGMTKSNVEQGAQKRNVTEWNVYSNNPVSNLAKEWEGWGTALKPAHEPIVMGRKRLSENTVVDNVLEWGTGGINIDDSRIPYDENNKPIPQLAQGKTKVNSYKTMFDGQSLNKSKTKAVIGGSLDGRFPANVIFDEDAGKLLDEQSGHLKSGFMKAGTPRQMSSNPNVNTYGHWEPDKVRNDTYGDEGGASRFFYCPKTSKTDRNEGLDDFETKKSSSMPGRRNAEDMSSSKIDNDVTGRFVTLRQNFHPTVKPTDLMLYLIRLVTPKGGTTIDPFMGSGSTGKAAVRGGFDFIGIEREKEYFEIAEARIQYEIDNPYNEERGERIMINKNSQKFW